MSNLNLSPASQLNAAVHNAFGKAAKIWWEYEWEPNPPHLCLCLAKSADFGSSLRAFKAYATKPPTVMFQENKFSEPRHIGSGRGVDKIVAQDIAALDGLNTLEQMYPGVTKRF